MDFASEVLDSAKPRTNSADQSYCSNHLAVNQTSQELVISSHDELHWCADMDYQLSCDNMFRSQPKDTTSEISFTNNSSELNSLTTKNFDIHLAQIDIETFRSEDIERIRHNHSLSASNDTLRIVDSLASLSNHLHLPNDECEAISLDSLDISIDKEINSELIQKCSQSDKTRYKIAMIDTSAHSQLQNSMVNSSDVYSNNYLNKYSDLQMKNDSRVSKNPFVQGDEAKNMNEIIQSPGSFVRLFIQNKINSNENSYMENATSNSSHIYDCKNNNDTSKCDNLFENIVVSADEVDESTGHSLNTVDSNELPLHVLDLSKKLRSLNLNKQFKYGSASISSNTSFTSTTTSSSTATFDKRRQSHTNPFVSMHEEKKTKSAATQFPDLVQDKEVQACFDSDVIREAPVLVYYPNYSLPDLSFLQDVFKHERSSQQIYLSPVKHEPPKIKPENNVPRRISNQLDSQKKCRPKSYTDYEMLLNQDFSHITDWDSLNLLLPDDFKDFIEKNNLLNSRINKTDRGQMNGGKSTPQPIKTTLGGNNHRILQSVKRRSQPLRQPASKRYSLQEPTFDVNSCNRHMNYPIDIPYSDETNSCMTRSQTMPNCRMSQNQWPPNQPSHMAYFQPHPQTHQANMYHNCCHTCCHSTCHSPSFNSSQSSPQKPNFNWDLLSSSSSFKKLLSFLNKLDECSLHSDSSSSTKADTQRDQNIQVKAQYDAKPRSTTTTIVKRPVQNLTGKAEPNKTYSTQQPPKRAATASKQNLQSKATSPVAQTSNNKPYMPNRSKSSATEPTKIILKRPTSLNKNSMSGIPVPKRTSSRSMIPVSNNTQLKDIRPKVARNKSGNTRI